MDLAEKTLFLLDLDRHRVTGGFLLPGAADFPGFVLATGGTVRYLTNNSSRGVDAGLTKMRRLGVPASREEFLTAVEATVYYLRQNSSPADVYYAVGTASFRRQLAEAGLTLRDTPDDDVTAVLVGFDTELTYAKVEDACGCGAGVRIFWQDRTGPANAVGCSTIAALSASSSAGRGRTPLHRKGPTAHDSPGLNRRMRPETRLCGGRCIRTSCASMGVDPPWSSPGRPVRGCMRQ